MKFTLISLNQIGTMLKLVTIAMVISAVVAQQEGRKFLVVFPPDYRLSTNGLCQIIIHTDVKAEISIQYHDTTDSITVNVGSYIHNLPCTVRAPLGHGDVGILMESDVDISVNVYSMNGSGGDAYLALPLQNQEAEYVLTSTDKPCDSHDVNNFYTMAAEVDNTVVFVYAPGSGGYMLVDTINMDRLGTYTNGSASRTPDYRGWKLQSSSAISVVSGSACSRVNVDSCNSVNAHYIMSPSTDKADHQFIVPTITKANPGDSGAYIIIFSFTHNNLITLPDQSIQETLQPGQYFQYYINPYDDITRINCKDACIVVLYNELRCSTDEGGFLFYVTPLDRGADYARFIAMERTATYDLTNYVTVIAQTENILLDGSPLTGWRPIPEWNYFDVAVPVDHGGHVLESHDESKFVAFVYGGERSWGYGTEIVHGESTLPPGTTTTASPELPGVVPAYRISLVSNWTSSDDMETQCTNQYTNEIRQKTLQMAVHLNDAIGATLCVEFNNEEMIITSSTASFFSSTNSGFAFVSFVLTPESNIAMGDVLACAEEIAVYSKPHITWGAPLLDSLPNCADPVFETGVFYDSDHQWVCQNEKIYEEFSSSIPLYYLELVDVGKTDDDSDLSPECSLRYSLSLDDKALWMRSQLNPMIGTQLCQGISGIALAAPQTSLTVQGSSALIRIDFVLIHESTVSGGEALLCAEDILEYVQCYNNWQPPLLPPETGCPQIQLDNQCFDETSRGWVCNI